MSVKRLSSFLKAEELDLDSIDYTDEPASCMCHTHFTCYSNDYFM